MDSPSLCSFCKQKPVSFGQRYCCLACEILDGLKSKEKKQGTSPTDLPTAEDHAIQSLFGIPEKGGYKYFCEVEPIACAACLFPLAQLPQYVDGLTDLRWDRHTNRLSFTLPQDRSSPTYVFQLLKKMGLAPRWYRINETANRSQPQSSSLRIGVTGALFGNIMLFAIPIYGGLSGELANIFFFIQGLLFLPVLFWSARPFYQGALVGLRTNTLSTDLPLSLAFLVGSIFSYVGLFLREKEWIYFDSLSGFIFLILLSRYLLERAVIKEETSIPIENFLETSVLPIFDEQNKDKPLAWKSIFQLKAGDIIGLEQQQRLPANGILLDSQAEFEHSWMTGEWEPETYGKNSPIPAGSRLLSSKAYLRLEQNPEESQFIKLLQSLKSTGQKISTQEESLIGQILVLGSFLGAVALAFIAPHLGTLEILRRSLALWIVACPCAVSFIAPLTRALGARLAYHLGFWIRDAGVFHKLPKVKTIAFDKTGTITQTLINIDQDAPLLDNWLKRVILSLESISCHPIARAFRATFGAMELLPVTNHREIIGQGVEGQIDGHHFQITKSAHNPQVIELKKNDKAVVSFSLKESIPHPLIQWLKNLSSRFNLYVISGDHPSRVEELTRLIEIPTSQTFSQMSPVQKKELIQKIKPDLFVGDGTNDLLAMQEAPLSIAMGNASIEAQKASQIIMMHNNLSALDDLFELSKNIMILLRRNLTIAVTYNILAAAAALSGIIGPFEAAVLMPLSSTLLLLSTYFKTKWLRSLETGQTKIIPSSTPPAFNAIKEH